MSFLLEETLFQSFTWSHFLPLLLFAMVTVGTIYYANKYLNEQQKSLLGCYIAIIPLFFVVARVGVLIYLGRFDSTLDLPIHLCRITALIAPYIMYKRQRFWLGMLYFWIIVGTLNANITPDLANGFPHFEYLCYFGLHSGLMILPFYAVFVYGLRITWQDLWKTFFMTNLFFFVVYGLNLILGSNYMYTMHKPDSASIIDYMGPWPWYILTGQFVVLIMMMIAFAPFKIFGPMKKSIS